MADTRDPAASLSPAKRALLQKKLRESEGRQEATEAIAIIGMGCRFPGGASSPETFWQNLLAGVDAITPVPPDRWDNDAFCDPRMATPGELAMRWGGFVGNAGQFDPAFFGISPREAIRMDPQQRMLLEVAWETLEDAGVQAEGLRGTSTGVFIGVQSQSIDYYYLQLADIDTVEFQTNTGGAHSIIANRLSYFLDLRGPSFTVDTACSSSLVALHLACQSLRLRECNLAFAGGTNLIAAPETSIAYTKLGFMAPDGRCKTFDSRANGFVRGEGCGVILLKRLSDARKDHDPVIAVIRGTAVNQDGTTNGLTAPNGLSQQAVIRTALHSAGLEPSQIGYVETHGTGTILGDPIEVEALASVLAAESIDRGPCYLGAVKTNIGHLESAAGIAGIIKAALCLRHQLIPPNLHFGELNPHILLDGTRLRIPTDAREWVAKNGPRFAGVSSFGFGGTNAHAILEEAPAMSAREVSEEAPPWRSLTISAHSRKALTDVARAHIAFLQGEQSQKLSPRDISYTACLRRSHLSTRAVVVGRTHQEWADGLQQLCEGAEGALPAPGRPGLAVGDSAGRPQIVFVFSGQGPQWYAMGRELFAEEPVYRQMIERCASLLAPLAAKAPNGPWDLVAELKAAEDASRLDMTEIAQPAVFALQAALLELWKSWGVHPDCIIGHSLGEIAAAYAAGILQLEDAIRVVYHRGRVMQRAAGKGRMAAVGLSAEQASREIKGFEKSLLIGAFNSPNSVVLSGESDALQEVLASIGARGIFNRMLPGDFAFHSPVMEPYRAELAEALDGIKVEPPRVPIVSTVTGLPAAQGDYGPEYWGRNIREPVRFSDAVQKAVESGGRVFLEIGPHPVLGLPLSQCLHEVEKAIVLPSLRRESPERATMLTVLGNLHAWGYPIDWRRFFPEEGRCVSLPHYPWQHSLFWIERRATEGKSPLSWMGRKGEAEGEAPGPVAADVGRYEVQWIQRDRAGLAHQEARTEKQGRTGWLVFADHNDMGEAFAEEIRRRRETCILVRYGDGNLLETQPGCYRMSTNPGDDTRGLVNAVTASTEVDEWNVVYFWGLDAKDPVETDLVVSRVQRQLGCDCALRLAQTMQEGHGEKRVRLWFVTRGAQPVQNQKPLFMQAPLWGLGRTLAFEMPDVWGGVADLDPEEDPQRSSETLLEEILSPDDEDQVAFRKGARLVPRLCLLLTQDQGQKASLCDHDGAYLVTGAPDGLGIRVALWLAEQGAGHLVVVGAAGEGLESDRAAGTLRTIEKLGARIRIVTGDPADHATLAAVFDEFGRTVPPLRGIVQAAGGMDPVSAAGIDESLIARTFHQRAEAALLLHSLSQGIDLDFFVLFSSASAIMGSRDLAHFGAANHFVDVLAHRRRAQGLPALSVNWGWWPEAGTAEALAAYYPRIGLNPISSERAFNELAALLRIGCTDRLEGF
jgi:myxalamid-type polyketide synthase MxaC